MFKKIISNLPFSPSLMGQLSYYAGLVKKEASIRRLGFIFLSLTLVVQFFAVFEPPESANAASEDDMISRGFDSTDTCSVSNDSLFCNQNLKISQKADNYSQGLVDAQTVAAAAQDQISYTLTIENISSETVNLKIKDRLADILEYSTLIDNGGGILDESTNELSWPNATIASKTTQTRTFVVRLMSTIPSTAQGKKYTKSYDCVMTNNFGNSINIALDCPTPKVVENIASYLPKIKPFENIMIASTAFILTAYLYLRSQLIKKEIRIIRHNANMGTIQ